MTLVGVARGSSGDYCGSKRLEAPVDGSYRKTIHTRQPWVNVLSSQSDQASEGLD